MYKPYKKIKMYEGNESFLYASVRVKALLAFAYSHDWYLSTYRSYLTYYSMLQISIYKNFYIVSDADNFKKLSLIIS